MEMGAPYFVDVVAISMYRTARWLRFISSHVFNTNRKLHCIPCLCVCLNLNRVCVCVCERKSAQNHGMSIWRQSFCSMHRNTPFVPFVHIYLYYGRPAHNGRRQAGGGWWSFCVNSQLSSISDTKWHWHWAHALNSICAAAPHKRSTVLNSQFICSSPKHMATVINSQWHTTHEILSIDYRTEQYIKSARLRFAWFRNWINFTFQQYEKEQEKPK